MKSFITVLLAKYNYNDQVEEDELRAGQGMQHAWGEEEYIHDFGGKAKRKERTRKT
jgi:hypothetical protein